MKKPIVIYDGDCGFCLKSLRVLKKLDWLNCFDYHPLQNEYVYSKFNLTQKDCKRELKLVYPEGIIFGGADAMIRICFRLPVLALIGYLFWLPPLRQLSRWLYKVIANNRHRFSS